MPVRTKDGAMREMPQGEIPIRHRDDGEPDGLARPLPGRSGMVLLFEEWAAKAPDRAAVVDREGTVSYGELNAAADLLARLIEAGAGSRRARNGGAATHTTVAGGAAAGAHETTHDLAEATTHTTATARAATDTHETTHGPAEAATHATVNGGAADRTARAIGSPAAVDTTRAPKAGETSDEMSIGGHGGAAGEVVAILAGRTAGTMAGMLAAMKAGAAYLPLDPEYPASRLELVLRDSGARTVLVPDGLRERLPAFDGTVLELPVFGKNQAHDMARTAAG